MGFLGCLVFKAGKIRIRGAYSHRSGQGLSNPARCLSWRLRLSNWVL